MQDINITIYISPDSKAPEYADCGCSGADVFAVLDKETVINPGGSMLVHTGLKVEIPEGYEIQVRPKSGLALRRGITVLNTPGTIDSSYRGEIGVILINHGRNQFEVKPGMKVAQIVCVKVERMNFIKVSDENLLNPTERGSGGFGSTGL
jgi:dUTP pyrophosphatase